MRLNIITTCCLIVLLTNIEAHSRGKIRFNHLNTFMLINSNPYNNSGLHIISLSFGAAGWYSSLQSGMANKILPIEINLGYGRSESPFGLMLGANILSTYILDDFLLKPNYFSLAFRYQPLKMVNPFKNIRFYTFVGVNISYTKFTEQEYSGIISYENKVEKQFGYGVHLGASLTYKIKYFEIGPSLVYNTGKSNFYAGYFTKQTFNTGSLQLNIHVKYNIVFDRNKNACPAYRNFQRFEL